MVLQGGHPSEKLRFIADKMSMVQIHHYMRRQMRETGMSSREMLTTWSDYLSMACRLKMDTGDAIIYRARKLRQRHDELVELCGQKEHALRAGRSWGSIPMWRISYRKQKRFMSMLGKTMQ